MKHVIKIGESYANAVYSGDKNFEVRYNDRGYNKNDEVEFEVYEDNSGMLRVQYHPLNHKRYKITYVYSGVGLDQDYVVFGIEPIDD